jgi:hypothetical protein
MFIAIRWGCVVQLLLPTFLLATAGAAYADKFETMVGDVKEVSFSNAVIYLGDEHPAVSAHLKESRPASLRCSRRILPEMQQVFRQ